MLRRFALSVVVLFLAATVHGAAFAPGNIVVQRVGTGAAALNANSTAVFLEEYAPAGGAAAQVLALPTAVSGSNKQLTVGGSTSSEGLLSLSTDGQYLLLGGYALNPGVATPTAAANNRVIGRVDYSGAIDTSTAIATTLGSGNLRSVTSDDGTRFWVSTSGVGVHYAAYGATSSTQILATPGNMRAVRIFNNNLYGSSGSTPFVNVFSISGGLATSGPQTATSFSGMPTTAGPSPYPFLLLDRDATVAGFDSLYVADDRTFASGGGIQKWSFDGSTWTLRGTVAADTGGMRGLTGAISGGNVVLYATTTQTSANKLVTYTDAGAFNAAPSGSFTTLATAATNTVYRGVAFAPEVAAGPAPTVTSIVRASTNPTNASSVDFTVTFSESVTGVDETDFVITMSGVTGATVGTISGSGTTYTVPVNTGSGSGTIRLDVNDNDTITNGTTPLGGSGNDNGDFDTGESFDIDRTAPAVQSIVPAGANPTNAGSVDFTVTFTEPVTGDGTYGIATTGSLAGTSVTNVTGAGVTRTVTVNTGTGTGDLRLDFIDDDTVTDGVGNTTAANFTAGNAYTIDRDAPAVQSIALDDPDPTAAATVDFLVTFTESVTGVEDTDFAVTTTGGISGTSVTGVAGTGATRTVTVNTGTGSGTVRLDFTGVVSDGVGNTSTTGFTTGDFYTVDRSTPQVASIIRAGTSPTNTNSVQFTVTFNTSVSGVDALDFDLDTTGTFTNVVLNVTGSDDVYTVTVTWDAGGEGTISIDVDDNDSITSTTSSEPLGGAGADNGDFTAGEAYTVDVTAPSVSSSVLADADPTNAATVDFTVTFSETVTGVDTADFTLNTTGSISGASVTGVSGTGPYTVTVNTGTGDGTIRLDVVDDGSIDDLAGNGFSAGFTGGATYTIDRTAPAVQSIVTASTNPTSAATVDYTVTFSEDVTGVGTGDFTITTTGSVSGTSVSNVTGGPSAYTVTVSTGTGAGTLRLDLVDNDSVIDGAGNPTSAGFTTGDVYTVERAPAAPTGLNATAGNAQVALTWNAVTGATGYNVKRATVSGGPYTTIAPNVATANHTDNTAVNGTQYYYVVSALNAFGESADSAQASATPSAPLNAIGVVISQLFGGNGGAYNQDYVELFNPTAGTVTLTGYALQYGSATGQFGSVGTNIYTFPNPTTIGAGRYLTVAFGTPSGTGAAVTSDINVPSGLNMSGSSGKVALTINGTALGCGATATPCTLPHANIVDVVAYGAGNNGEGGTSVKNGAALSTSEGGLRKGGGCQDTQNNNNDFDVVTFGAGLAPRTASTPANVCGPIDTPPTIGAISDPYTTVAENAAPFQVNLTGVDDLTQYTWAATPGTGIASVNVTGGQGTMDVTYTVTLQTNYYGTATFTAALSDGVNPSTTKTVNIAVTRDLGINHVPTITPPPDPYTAVAVNPGLLSVSLTGNDDNDFYSWGATAGTGVSSVGVSSGFVTANVTYDVAIQTGFIGTATFTATLSDGVNPATNQTVNISVTPTGSSVNHVVISQLYGGGGNASATFSHDYIEIYNPTGSPVNLSGWTLQYSSATNTGPFSGIAPLGGIIGPAEYFLVQLASNDTSVGAPLVSPTLTGDINMSGSNGKIALVNNSAAITGTCGTLLTDPNIVDFVGYGTANCSEGNNNAPTPGNNQTALFRASNGDVDTDNNGNDFTTGTPAPKPHVAPVEVGPFVVSTDPGSGDSNAPRDANLVIVFNESVDATGSWYDINCVTSGNHNSATFSRSGSRSWTIVPNVNFIPGEQCTATLFAALIVDTDTDDGGAGTNFLASDHTWSFTISTGTAPAYPMPVHLTLGNPSDAVADLNVPDNYLMEKPELTLSYNRSRSTPNWVSWHLADEWVGTLTRVDTFRADPAIDPTWYRVLGSDYSGSGFDRGHLVPNADRDKETSSPINQATFLMTNMLPQAPDNNQGPWANMENYLRTLLPANELYIVAGGHGIGGTGSNGLTSTITTLNNGTITVPAQTWKVVLILPKASGDDVARVTASSCTLAVLMPNTQGIRTNDPNDWMGYITTVDAIEALTGYDFFEAVPDAIEAAIEGGTNCVNPPGAASKTATVAEEGSTGITLEGSSPSNSPLTYVIVTNPANGQLTGSGANRTYTPSPDYFGSDSFTYKVNDGQDSNTATVTITVTEVNDAPAAADDAKAATAGTPLVFPAADLTTNDSRGPANESGQTLTVTAVTPTGSTNGTVSLSAGNVTYTASGSYSGPASFEYTVCDNGTTAGAAASLCATGIVNVTVNAAPPPVATHFSVTAPANVTNGVAFNVTVTALDASNATVTGYTGTVHFTSTSTGTLPADYTFVAGDNGAHTFSVNLTTNGAQTITATDTVTASITGTANTTVNAPPQVATHFSVTAPANVTNGVAFNVTVTALDASNATVTGYTGTVHFTSSSTGTLPSDYTFVAGDNGSHTFSVTLTTNGPQTITATDLANADINGTANTTVAAAPQVATHFSVTAPANVTNGVAFNVTVTALDASNATVTGYPGTVHFTSTSTGTLPADYTFVAGDNGVHTFSVTLTTNGAQTITATDTVTASITGTANTLVECSGPRPPATITVSNEVCGRSDGHQASTVTGASTYNWTITNGTITSGQGTPSITFASRATGDIHLHVDMTGPGSCDARTADADVMINPLPEADLPAEIHSCAGSTVQITARLTGTAPFTVRWADGLVQQSNSRNLTRSVVVNGTVTYTIDSVQDAACTSNEMRERVRVIADPTPVIDGQTREVKISRGQTATLEIDTPTSPVTIAWFEGRVGDTSVPVGSNSPTFTTPALVSTTRYWARLTTGCGSIDSQPMIVHIGGKTRSVRH